MSPRTERRVGSGDLTHNARPKTVRRVSPTAGSGTIGNATFPPWLGRRIVRGTGHPQIPTLKLL